MLPSKSHPRWVQLVKGQYVHNFSLVAGGMCVSRNTRQVRRDIETDPGAVQKAVDDIYEFFTKYEKILEDDIKAIFG